MLQGSAGHLGQTDLTPALQQGAKTTDARLAGIASQQHPGQFERLAPQGRDRIATQPGSGGLQVGLHGRALLQQQAVPGAEGPARSPPIQRFQRFGVKGWSVGGGVAACGHRARSSSWACRQKRLACSASASKR